MQYIITTHSLTPIFDHMAKFIFVYSQPPLVVSQHNTVALFAKLGIFKIILICESSNRIYTLARKHINQIIYYGDMTDPKILFPDVLKNLEGNYYRVLVYQQVPRVIIKSNKVQSELGEFLKIVVMKQNAVINLKVVNGPTDVINYYNNRAMHLTINTAAVINYDDKFDNPKLLTYEENGYCALIPKPSSSFELILLKPFNWQIWIACLSSLLVAGNVWRLFKGRGAVDNVWTYLAGVYAFFLGQSISFRNNHFILTTMLQIIIFAIIILSCLYQGELTASMIEPPAEQKLSTFDELYESDYKLLVGDYGNFLMSNFENYEAFQSRINVSVEFLANANFKSLANDNYALIMRCYLAKYELENKGAKEYYYLLDHQILKYFVRLEASYNNPYFDRLQELMDWSFEAGLHQAWKMMVNLLSYKLQTADDEVFLKLKDFKQVFCILGIGLLVATLVFIMEIVYHKFGENIYMRWIYFKDEIFLWRNSRRVRNFRVRPA